MVLLSGLPWYALNTGLGWMDAIVISFWFAAISLQWCPTTIILFSHLIMRKHLFVRRDFQPKNTQHNDRVISRGTLCWVLLYRLMQCVFVLSFIKVGDNNLNVSMQNVNMPKVIMPSVIMLNVLMLNVVAPLFGR